MTMMSAQLWLLYGKQDTSESYRTKTYTVAPATTRCGNTARQTLHLR